MKKIVLSLACVLTAAAFAPEASALPVFARQTGMACNACHFQNFPALNTFGRAFKTSGFSLVGAQGKIEGEGVSIPDTVNASLLTTLGYASVNTANPSPAPTANGNGNGWFVPGTGGEFSLFVGGRISDFAGAISELGFADAGGAGSLGAAKIAMLPEFAGGHAGAVFFTTGDKGASYGYEALNTGANAVHTMFFVAGDNNGSIQSTLSAQQYVGIGVAATGASLVYANDMGYVNLTKYHMAGPGATNGMGASLSSNYLRLVGTFDVAGWDSAIGIQSFSGASAGQLDTTVTPTTAVTSDTKATAIDGQMQGDIGSMPAGFYISYATAPVVAVTTDTSGNIFNNPGTAVFSRHSLNISTEIGVAKNITVGAAIRRAQNGLQDASGAAITDNAWLINAGYLLRQNMMMNLVFTKQSGTAWDAANGANGGDRQIAASMAIMY